MNYIPLAKAIQDLRSELSQAMREGEGESLRFRPESIELELGIEATCEAGGEVKAKFWVVEAGVEGKGSRSTTHKLTLKLHPVDSRGEDVLIRDKVSQRPGG
jgi:hypothetical protein